MFSEGLYNNRQASAKLSLVILRHAASCLSPCDCRRQRGYALSFVGPRVDLHLMDLPSLTVSDIAITAA